MATRIFLRKNGSSEPGCMAKLPATWAELLAVADTKLFRQPGSGAAKRVFAAAGDEILDDDYDLIESNDTLYVSLGEDWRAPAAGGPPLAAAPPQEQPSATPLAPVPAGSSTTATASAVAVAASSPAVEPASDDGPASPTGGASAPATAASPAASTASPSGAAGASPSGAGAMEVDGAEEAKEEEGAEAGDEMDADLFQVEEILARRLQPESAYLVPTRTRTLTRTRTRTRTPNTLAAVRGALRTRVASAVLPPPVGGGSANAALTCEI